MFCEELRGSESTALVYYFRDSNLRKKVAVNSPSFSYCFVEGSWRDEYLSFAILSNQAIPVCYLIYSMATIKLF